MMNIPSDRGAMILVVDDIARNLQLLGSILTSKGFEVLFATSGESALERLDARAPDLILLDLMMPGMDGMEVCRRVKSSPKTMDIPIIILTAANDAENAAKALSQGAVDYIFKPFNTAELLARVRTHVALKRIRDELHRIIIQKNELLSGVAHDLKNPISSIRFSALMLRDEGLREPDPRAELVDSIIESCDNALEVIQLRLTRNARLLHLEHVNLAPVELLDSLAQVIQENLPAAYHKQLDLDLDFDDSVSHVEADREALYRVLNNLISNAIKFSPAGRRILVKVSAANDREFVRLNVIDEGPGLSPEDIEHLYEPYRRLSAQPTGGESSTGLGLSITHQLVTRMQGRIGCDSKHGAGATFWIELRKCGISSPLESEGHRLRPDPSPPEWRRHRGGRRGVRG